MTIKTCIHAHIIHHLYQTSETLNYEYFIYLIAYMSNNVHFNMVLY